MSIEEFVPKDKSDIETVNRLKSLSYPEYKPILGELLEWIQDINWPVAIELIPLLLNANIDLVPHIEHILKTDDEIWKYWVLERLVLKLPKETKYQLLDTLKKIVNNPSESEKLEEVDVIAQQILNSRD